MKKLSALILLLVLFGELKAQDPQFSQFYAAPMYHNPAFTGAAQKGRLVANYRNQWPVPGSFVTSSFSADSYLKKYNSGFGLIATFDQQGSAGLYTLYSSFNYAYEISLSNNWIARAGLAFGFVNRGINRNKLLLGDQLNLNGTPGPQSDAIGFVNTSPVLKFDVSSGFLIYNKYFWLGGSAMHMSQPNLAIFDDPRLSAADKNIDSDKLPMRVSIMAGAKIPLVKRMYGSNYGNRDIEKTFTPTIIYKRQGDFQQFDIGGYITIKPIVFGVYYRDIPFNRDVERGGFNRDALIFLLGFKHDYFSAGYSYDLTVSRLSGSSGGAHEISISYEFDNPKRRKRKAPPIPCPKF